MMKTMERFIEQKMNDEILEMLHSRDLYAADDIYDENYQRLHSEIINDKSRNWDYEYDQYCQFMTRLYREKNYR